MIRGNTFNTPDIFPTPKHMRHGGRPLALDGSRPVFIVLGPRPAPPERAAAEELRREWLRRNPRQPVSVQTHERPEPPAGVSIWLGTTDSHPALADACRREGIGLSKDRPGREGYIIRFLKQSDPALILCGGSDPTGVYFAVQSLKQLCVGRGPSLALCPAAIEDWPTCRYRGMKVTGGADETDRLARYKFNNWELCYTLPGIGHRWRNPSAGYRRRVRTLSAEAARRGLNCTPFINPLDVEGWKWGGPHTIRISSERDIGTLYAAFRIALEAGSRCVNLCLDDFASGRGEDGPATDYILTDSDDRRRFGNDLGRAHAHLVRRIHERIRSDFPGAVLIVTPAYYFGIDRHQPAADAYLRALGELPEGIVIMWTGPTVRSLVIRPDHFQRYAGLIRRAPAYWDNTIYARPGSTYYLFDLYAQGYYPGWVRDTGFGMHCNGVVAGSVNEVAVMQIADYLWNPESYDAERSRARALNAAAGREMASDFIRFHDVFEALHDGHAGLRLKYARIPDAPLDRDAYRVMRRRLAEMTDIMRTIERRCPNAELVEDLRLNFYRPLVGHAAEYRARVRPHLAQRVPAGLFLPAESFWGGYPETGRSALHGRPGRRQATRALFPLARRPRRDGLISLRAEDVSAIMTGRLARIRILLNGRTLWRGPSGFEAGRASPRAYHVRRHWLRRGLNTLAIENLETDGYFRVKVYSARWIPGANRKPSKGV